MPAFIPPAKPVLRPSASTRTSGNCSASAASEPSVEPLSTTRSSSGGGSCASTDATHRGTIAPPFQFRTTTDVVAGGAGTGLQSVAGRAPKPIGRTSAGDGGDGAADRLQRALPLVS